MHRNEMVARWRTLLSAIVRRGPRNLALGLLLPLLCTACASANAFAPTSVPAAQTPPAQPSAIPLLAYYYIWFDPGSWDRAKTDLPLLGAYSSDDRKVALQHIQWAKSAGINGFIVSWKSTPTLNHRLQLLIDIAKQEHFKLLVIYQGLDFDRNPLPVARVAADLDYFIATFASDPVFDLYERPVVIWSGTWKFSRDEIASVTAARRQKLLILASERMKRTTNGLLIQLMATPITGRLSTPRHSRITRASSMQWRMPCTPIAGCGLRQLRLASTRG